MVMSNTLWAVVVGAGIVGSLLYGNGVGGGSSHPVMGVCQPALTVSATPEFNLLVVSAYAFTTVPAGALGLLPES